MIQINKRWAVKRSKMAVSLCKSYKVKGELEWREMYFFSNIPQALEKLVDMAVLRGLDKGSWKDVITEVQAVRADILAVQRQLQVEVREN